MHMRIDAMKVAAAVLTASPAEKLNYTGSKGVSMETVETPLDPPRGGGGGGGGGGGINQHKAHEGLMSLLTSTYEAVVASINKTQKYHNSCSSTFSCSISNRRGEAISPLLCTMQVKTNIKQIRSNLSQPLNAIAKSGKINRRLAHSIVIGPPGSGKSSMLDRLLKRLRRRIANSTGVCNSVIIVDIDEINPSSFHVATGIDTETWKEVDYEVSIVNQLGEKSSEKPPRLSMRSAFN